jgi:hypothetical protein
LPGLIDELVICHHSSIQICFVEDQEGGAREIMSEIRATTENLGIFIVQKHEVTFHFSQLGWQAI